MFRGSQSVRVKLVAMILLGSLVPIASVLAIFAIQDVRAIRNQIVSEDTLIATIIADYSAGDLAFENRRESEKSLAMLSRLGDVEYAALYDARGERFSAYKKSDVPESSIPARVAASAAPSVETFDGHI